MSLTEISRAESLDEQENRREDGEKKPKNRRPASAKAFIAARISLFESNKYLFIDTAFRQQRLKAWQ